ncbi:hypothetical protein PoB_000230900 [Plakobranchus ocellatus]|uniref:Uncharacterized protein n=1 Tax=Plakobranchus ocellatus TaxID=259542 RepID=A0AAV3Y1F5_9GAST|nr:hypothetical protein PoB_000230900 [Plakobranchus ocellatus]
MRGAKPVQQVGLAVRSGCRIYGIRGGRRHDISKSSGSRGGPGILPYLTGTDFTFRVRGWGQGGTHFISSGSIGGTIASLPALKFAGALELAFRYQRPSLTRS